MIPYYLPIIIITPVEITSTKVTKNKIILSIEITDERLSSVAVNRAMIDGNMRREFRKEHKDELAAVVILQGYLDFKR